MLKFIDEAVAKVMDRVESLGIEENTIIMFASDNGPMVEGGYRYEYHNSNGIYRGGKRDMYEGGIHTPFIVKWPGTIAPGQTSDHITAFWDFLPTACELAGVEIPDWTDGISIVPTLVGKPNVQKTHKYLYWEFYGKGGKQAVRAGKWKGVRLNVSKDRNGPIELYNLDVDPSETNNIADEHPEVVSMLDAYMKEAHVPSSKFSFEKKKKGRKGKAKGKRKGKRRNKKNRKNNQH